MLRPCASLIASMMLIAAAGSAQASVSERTHDLAKAPVRKGFAGAELEFDEHGAALPDVQLAEPDQHIRFEPADLN